MTEPWLDRKKLAAHFSCSVRSVEQAMAEGLPATVIFGRAKFRASEAERWLEEHGHLRRPDDGSTVASNASGAALREQPAP